MDTPDPRAKLRGRDKFARLRVQMAQSHEPPLPKPDWLRVRLPSNDRIHALKERLRSHRLHTVCEEASCPNLPECFSHGTATFMIMGDKCTRRCAFCDVAHGKPDPLNPEEPHELAEAVASMGLRYVVITSVDRDDLRDGGAAHFVACMRAVRQKSPHTQIEILVPDFRGRVDRALDILLEEPPEVFNHNVETIARFYPQARAGSDYQVSLKLLQSFKARAPSVPTKSGAMLGLGETFEEVLSLMRDLRAHDVDRITLGQYLRPSPHHLPVARYVPPEEFDALAQEGYAMGFSHVASGPLVRSSYHADLQASGAVVR